MVLSKRERYIALGTLTAVGILVLDRVALTPLMDARQNLKDQIDIAQTKLRESRAAIKTARANRRVWASMRERGLTSREPSEAEGEVLNNVRQWAQDARMTLSSLKPERVEKEKDFQKSSIRVTGAGGMSEIARFLWYVQTASIAVQVNELQINARKEGSDDLTVQVLLSTIYLPSDGDGRDQPGTATRPREAQP